MYTNKLFCPCTSLPKMPRLVAKFQPLSAITLCLVLVFSLVQAETFGPNYPSLQDSNFQPSLPIVIGILGVMFVLTILILVYARLCHRPSEPANGNRGQNRAGILSPSGRFSGIDKTVIESLPFFRFSSLKGSREGLECAVCLSKFEDVEVLRLLPKCKHAFHIDCIDHWLEKHSSCPLCRHRVSSEDLKLITHSNSMRFLWNNSESELREETNNMEIFVQREESHRGSSRFSIGNSFRKVEKECDREELLARDETEEDERVFHKLNHKIVVSGFVFNNRWSNVSSSDLIFLSSEMLNDASSGRFSSLELKNETLSTKKAVENEEIAKIKEEIEIKKAFENKVGAISTSPVSNHPVRNSVSTSRFVMNSGGQRSVSEITAFSRQGNSGVKNKMTESCSLYENDVREERVRKIWLPIATRTVQWFANRERSQSSQNPPQRQSIDV